MTGHELQYIASTNGSFDCTLSKGATVDSVIEQKFLSTSYFNVPIYFGVDYSDVKLNDNSNYNLFWYAQTSVENIKRYWTLNEEHTVTLLGGEYKWNGVSIWTGTSGVNSITNPRFRPNVKGHINYFKITTNGVDDVYLVAWEDGNGTLGLYDKVNDVFYTPATGTWTAGPVAHTFQADKQSLRFEASGGTNTLEITAETGWTCTTPTAFTMSTTTGTTGTTTITVTAPANTGSTKIEETITFTDADNYTFDVKLRQKVDGVGFSYLQIGEDTIDTFYIGDLQIEALYMGEEQIYGSGPFVGLKATNNLAFSTAVLTGTLKIKSSENWSLTDNSTVGSYYTLENYTTGCNGWVPTYDGSLDGGELGEEGLWFEWEYGVSDKPFQEWVDGLAAYGITATGSYCSGARYSVYLNPHQTGGPGWLSYSQTTGGTGETIVTVTASTAQSERTATITISSANFTATTSVNQAVYYKPAYNEIYYTTIDGNAIGSEYNQGQHVVSITYGDNYGVITFDGVPYLNGLYSGGHFGGTGSVTRWWLPEQITSKLAHFNFEWQDYVVEMFCYMTSNVPSSIFQNVQETTPAIMHIPVGASSAYTYSGIYAYNKSNWTVVEDL